MKWTRTRLALAVAVLMLVVPGCNDDDDVINSNVSQTVETGMDQALGTTVVPLVQFYGALGDLFVAPVAGAVGGVACPETTGWCSSGSVSCTPTITGLAFAWDECVVTAGNDPITVDGNLAVFPGTPIGLTLTNLFLNNSPAISGSGTINVGTCTYSANIQTADALVTGTIVQCDDDSYPTGNTLAVTLGDILVTIVFDGSSVAHATATQGAATVASCTIDLAADPLTTSCGS